MSKAEWIFAGWLTVLSVVIAAATGGVFSASSRIDSIYTQQAGFAADIAETKTAVSFIREDVAEIKEIVRRIDVNVQRAALDSQPFPALAEFGVKGGIYQSMAAALAALKTIPATDSAQMGAVKIGGEKWLAIYGPQQIPYWNKIISKFADQLERNTSGASPEPEKSPSESAPRQ